MQSWGLTRLPRRNKYVNSTVFWCGKYHPDLHPGDANAAHMMEQVNAAYEVLGNPSERRDYDAQLRLSSERPSERYTTGTAADRATIRLEPRMGQRAGVTGTEW